MRHYRHIANRFFSTKMSSTFQAFRSIEELRDAITQGKTTATAVTKSYIQQIKELDQDFNAIISVNPKALEDAEKLDKIPSDERGPLHGVPLILKDQIETIGIPTTFGSKVCKDYIPSKDATIVRKLKEAGAIVLAKSTMCDWAAGWFSTSSMSGTTKHPIDGSRDPGGSSAGSGTAIALGMAPAAIGGDTGGSIRLPSSFCGLVGVRVTPGRISRSGMSPLVSSIDTPGPMCQNVKDAAKLLDVMVGYDEEDDYTSIEAFTSHATSPTRFSDAVQTPVLEGKRIGVLRQAFGSHRGILQVLDKTLASLTEAGAHLVEVEIPDLDHFKSTTAFYILQSKFDINSFLASRKNLSHLKIEDLHEAGIYHHSLDLIDSLVKGPKDPTQSPHFGRGIADVGRFRRALSSPFAKHRLDALIYPTCQVLAPKTKDVIDRRWDSATFPTNTVIASQSSFTAVSVPVGKVKDDEHPNDPLLPVGLEILGVPLSEERILNIAAAIEELGLGGAHS